MELRVDAARFNVRPGVPIVFRFAILLLIISLVAGALGMTSIPVAAKRVAMVLFALFFEGGTGKTPLARHIAQGVDGEVKYAAFTGKAAQVMRSKGCYGASTIHSLIYRARESGEETPSFDLWEDAPASKAKLIIIDE